MTKRADQAARNAKERDRCAADPEYRARRREVYRWWAANNPDKNAAKNRRTRLRLRYGLTEMDYELGVAACGGRCEICGIVPDERLHVDHVHGTKLVRGLLCANCNQGIGKFKDDPDLLEKAAAYLRRTM